MAVLVCLLAGLLPLSWVQAEAQWDPHGYIIYCPCMGRFGNQAEHFLGALGFAKSVDRTLILPPWRTYKNIPFDEWFQVDPLKEYHRVILAEDFMREFAPEHWPPGERKGWCYSHSGDTSNCDMKIGNPFEPFWTELGVDFDDYVLFNIGFDNMYANAWKERFPPEKYPVMAFKGAPASFPVKEHHIALHHYLHWSEAIQGEASQVIEKHLNNQPFVGIHLRNGIDWVNACQHVEGMTEFMASPQCLGYSREKTVIPELCLPSTQEILRLTRKVVMATGVKFVFVATDRHPLTAELESHLQDQKVKVFHLDPWLPQIDLAILGQSMHFIGNCVSSFTSFVARERLREGKPTSYWTFTE
ncbi:GDP-fucose protein O-fucosyltransferase 1-like [Liolophura sinensis]|uniref:GDP-fucose protein O-fucosyltransferase 1-like n=1 Tax=Liolophura sinensis TaxID=3198878 RepID=UPI0031583CB3